MSNQLKVLVPLTASQGLSGSSATFSSLIVNGVTITGAGGGGSGTVNSGSANRLAYYPTTDAAVDDASGLLWDGSAFTVSGSTLTSGSVVISGGDLRLNNNAIKASDGNTSITLNSTSAKVEGDLTVGSGHFKVGNNVESLIANTATGYIAAQAGFAVTGSTTTSGSLTVGGNGELTAGTASLGGLTVGPNGITVNSGGANITGQLTANTGLVLTGGALLVESGGISGSSTLQVGGAATFANNVTVNGDLTVAGTTTTVNSTNLLIADRKVVFASSSSPTAGTSDTAGIYLGNDTSPVASLQYVSSALGATGHSWTSSENLNLSSSKTYKLDGVDVLSRTAGANTFSNSTIGSVTIASIFGTNTTAVSASAVTALAAPLLVLSGTNGTSVSNGFTVLGTSTLAAVNATVVTASTGVSASVFVLQDGTRLSSSAQLASAPDLTSYATKTGVENAYFNIRQTVSGTLNGSGYAEYDLTTNGASGKFLTSSLASISVDVMVHDGSAYTNDLAAVQLFISASKVWVSVDAPASPNLGYRLIAVDESATGFDVI